MNGAAIAALTRNDLAIHFRDRRGVLFNVIAAIFIAGFMGFLFGGSGKSKDAGKIAVVLADEDRTPISEAVLAALSADRMLDARREDAAAARDLVRKGKAAGGLVIPKGFGDAATRALFRGRDKPEIELLYDPSQALVQSVLEGLLAQAVMQEVSKAMFGTDAGGRAIRDGLAELRQSPRADTPEAKDLAALLETLDRLNARVEVDRGAPGSSATGVAPRGLTIPYSVRSEALTANSGVRYNGYAHSFAGMSVQFILFSGIEAGILLLMLRERGLWSRLRAAPISKADVLLARVATTTIVSIGMLAAIYAAAMLAFGVRIEGSLAGFVGIGVAFSLLNATFGLLLAAIGRTPAATRGLAIVVTLMLVMVGGAWVPAFVFPQWLQQASLLAPTRWAVDGLDAVTWRGLGFEAAIGPIAVLLGCAAVCVVIAVWRFRWQD